MSSRVLSVVLLTSGGVCVVVGAFLTFGVGIALIVLGALLVAADWLVPNR